MYQEIIDSLKKLQTPATRITSLGKLLNKTEGTSLQALIQATLSLLQQAHANKKVQGNQRPAIFIMPSTRQ